MFAQFSSLNQSVIDVVTRRVGEKISDFYFVKGELPLNGHGDRTKEFIDTVGFLNGEFDICSDLAMKADNGEVEMIVNAKKCRICPKGVGAAELKGTACPLPGLFETVSEKTMGDRKLRLVRDAGVTLKKVDNSCIIKYSR